MNRLLMAIIACYFTFFLSICQAAAVNKIESTANDSLSKNKLIGGQRDKHGCLGAAGYTWDDVVKACIRSWEIKSKEEKKAAEIAVQSLEYKKGLTVIKVEQVHGVDEFKVTIAIGEGLFEVILLEWKVISIKKTR